MTGGRKKLATSQSTPANGRLRNGIFDVNTSWKSDGVGNFCWSASGKRRNPLDSNGLHPLDSNGLPHYSIPHRGTALLGPFPFETVAA